MKGGVNLVFEGIGRVGKTSIISRMRELGIYKYKKLGPWDTISRLFFDFTVYFDMLNTYDDVFIIDRGHISELAYGPWYYPERYKDGVLYSWLLRNDKLLSYCRRETVIVYIEPNNFNIMEPDKRSTNREIDLALFRGAITQTSLRVINLRTQNDNGWIEIDNVIDNLMELI